MRNLYMHAVLVSLMLFVCNANGEMSAIEIADKMIEANNIINSVEGEFEYTIRHKLTDGGQHHIAYFQKLAEGVDSNSNRRETFEKLLEAAKEDVEDGFSDHAIGFSGVYLSPTRFSILRQELSNPESSILKFTSNGEKGIQYNAKSSHAIIDWSKKPGLIKNRSNELKLLQSWRDSVNQIKTNEKVKVLERTTYKGNKAVVVKQEPTPFSLDVFSITYTVLPDKGYIAAKTEFRENKTGTLVRVIEQDDIQEIQPGIWRPLETTETRYKLLSYDLDEYQELELDTIKSLIFKKPPAINHKYADSVFSINVPKGTAHIVDKTFKKPLELELSNITGEGEDPSVFLEDLLAEDELEKKNETLLKVEISQESNKQPEKIAAVDAINKRENNESLVPLIVFCAISTVIVGLIIIRHKRRGKKGFLIALGVVWLLLATCYLFYGHRKTETVYSPKNIAADQIQFALEQAHGSHKLVLVVFGGEWCSWCKKIHAFLESDPHVAQIIKDKFEVTFIDSDTNRGLAKHYGATLEDVPYFTILDSSGKVLRNQRTHIFEVGNSYDTNKLRNFLNSLPVSN